ncbi:hypothetical protein [Hymenobacter mucosus]|nr:hypothetical protein [Hymenobacter mucosus]
MAEVRTEKQFQGEASVFQRPDILRVMLQSLQTHRYLLAEPGAKSLWAANAAGTLPGGKDGTCFRWRVAAT